MKTKIRTQNSPTKSQVEQFEILFPLLNSVYDEIKEMSKKQPDGKLNEKKVNMINKILSNVKTLLAKDPLIEYLDILEDASIPSYSDVALILTQHKTALFQFRERHVGWNGFETDWVTID